MRGCTDRTAANFNPLATRDDGSCVQPHPDCTTMRNNASDPSCLRLLRRGCTRRLALNFDERAQVDDGSCMAHEVHGCTAREALNRNPHATIDDGSCRFAGCTDPRAANYKSEAHVHDDVLCHRHRHGCTSPTAVNFDAKAQNERIIFQLGKRTRTGGTMFSVCVLKFFGRVPVSFLRLQCIP